MTQQLPPLAIKISTSAGFEQRYFEHLKYAETHADAYESTEAEYQQYFGRRRYSCFKSFREVINNRRRKNHY